MMLQNQKVTEMTETEEKIVDAAIETFLRYGGRKTTMSDIAAAAGVSRQTVYTLFGDKDGIVAACIHQVTHRSLTAVRAGLETAETLSEQIDIYFSETVIRGFEMMQTVGDAEELISGQSAAGTGEIERSHARHRELIGRLLSRHAPSFAAFGQSPDEFANFVVTAATAAKHNAADRAELDTLLASLKHAVLSVAGEPETGSTTASEYFLLSS